MRLMLLICLITFSHIVQADPQWVSKPIQCASIQEVNERQAEYNLTPLLAAVTQARLEDEMYQLPWVMFWNSDTGYYTIVEYNPATDIACQILMGVGVDFDVADYFEKGGDPS